MARTPPVDTVVKWTETGKNVFALARDLLIFLLLLLLVGCPAVINTRLRETGITSVDSFGVKWENEAIKATRQGVERVNEMERIQRAAQESVKQLEAIGKANPDIAPQLAPVRDSLARATAQLGGVEERLASAVGRQQTILEQANPMVAPVTGWISTHSNVAQIRGDRKPGATVVVGRRPLRVRSQPGVDASVVTILPPGTEVVIEELGPSPWARIKRG